MSITLHQRFLYRGYLQIACCDLSRSNNPCLWLLTWDPTQPVATRPLAIQKDGTWYTYGWDLTKNICEVYGPAGYIRTAYTYAPYGEVSSDGDVEQPIQWSSEYNDAELALVYYNYRYYNSSNAEWICRDFVSEKKSSNLYDVFNNSPTNIFDLLGLRAKGKEFDGYHPRLGACDKEKDCIYNYARLREWIIAAINRRKRDFTAEWIAKGDKAGWNGHRGEYIEVLRHAGNCLMILEDKLNKNECCPRLPQYDSIPSWRESYDALDDPGEFPIALTPQGSPSPWALGIQLALLAFVAGQAGPQVAVPEEIFTVPGAFLTGVLLAL